ncbi:MAG TPA: hypothetical protein VM012_07415 [Flavitalea sp.]|nr:hypothetical protein [Flavitalea sp.]
MAVKIYLIVFVLFFSQGCNDVQDAIAEAKRETPVIPKENYIVLLDLSDRILFNNQQQVARDFTVVKCIYAVFKSKLNSKDPTHLYYAVNDKLKLLIAPQKSTPRNLYEMAGNLRIELAAEAPEKKAAAVEETEKTFNATLPEIYRQAVISNNTTDYSGADIWKYFNEDLEDDMEENGMNTLFIITDGYMDFEKTEDRPVRNNRFSSCVQIINALKSSSDWDKKFDEGDYGLLPVGKKFPNLRVVLVGINPKEEWNGEYNLLTRIWTKWFHEMGIQSYRLIKEDNINEVRESIEKFMNIKIAGKVTPSRWTKILDVDSSLIRSQETSVQVPRDIVFHPAVKKEKSTAVHPVRKSSEVIIPDESEADMLLFKKKDEPVIITTSVKPSSGKTDKEDTDILGDVTPKKGFNTGIKQQKKKQ